VNAAAFQGRERRVTAVVIGGGQAGIATSQQLTRRGIDHVVLERGEVANSWSTERWDSLRLLTPNWQTCFPDYAYQGDDPDGFMSMSEVSSFIGNYAGFCSAPVQTETEVISVDALGDGYRVQTLQGNWRCSAVVLATGPYNTPIIPSVSEALPSEIDQLTPHDYKNPDQLGSGGVLVVGAAATGMQIAREIQQSGRQVTLSVGEHLRMPRSYRGQDIQYWMHATGLLDECHDEVDDIRRLRNLPSPQLIGHPNHINLDINTLRDQGVNILGRFVGMQGKKAQFSGALSNVVKMADLKQQRLLASIDEWIRTHGEAAIPQDVTAFEPTRIDASPRLNLAMDSGEISTVIWATGFRPDYSWLNVPVLDRKGRLSHAGGITTSAGLYAMGLPFMRKRKSGFIFGAGDDATQIAAHLSGFIRNRYRSGLTSVA
jgi:putative flavoprotein involved in K+ transport